MIAGIGGLVCFSPYADAGSMDGRTTRRHDYERTTIYRARAGSKLNQRRDPAVQQAFDHARSGYGWAAQAERRKGATDRDGRPWRAAGAVFDGGGGWEDRVGRFRCGGLHQPAE